MTQRFRDRSRRDDGMAKRLESLMFVRELGTGAGTKVSLMRDVKDSKLYCKKYVSASAENWQSQIRQLKNEFDVGIGNSHPVLRKSLEYGIVKRKLRAIEAYNLLTYVEGLSLDKYAENCSPSLLTKIFWHVADGLQDLHNRGFVHADLKPTNILCAKNGRPTIIDFGQACELFTRKKRIQGTQDFIAKEQVERKALDQRTDIFGLGATMHRIFLGKSAETELNAKSVSNAGASLDRWRKEMREQADQLDPALLKLIEDCCQSEREDRPKNMQLIKDRLEVSFERFSKTG
ncbi:MAG: protein kinase [Phycisphaerales bacterium]|nr:protein kinase [Phycisphaerales bacterium]